jgi:hypothetical protein
VVKIELEAVLQRGQLAGQVLGANQPRCLGFLLVAIWRDIPTEDLTRLATNWGRPPTCPAGPSWHGLQPMGSTGSEADHGDLHMTFCLSSPCDL